MQEPSRLQLSRHVINVVMIPRRCVHQHLRIGSTHFLLPPVSYIAISTLSSTALIGIAALPGFLTKCTTSSERIRSVWKYAIRYVLLSKVLLVETEGLLEQYAHHFHSVLSRKKTQQPWTCRRRLRLDYEALKYTKMHDGIGFRISNIHANASKYFIEQPQ